MSRVLAALQALHAERGVRRAWPRDDGSLHLECADERGRLVAGRIADDGTVALLPHARDPRLPGLAAFAEQGDLVVHRFGRRAVVVAPATVVKVTRPSKVEGVLHASRVVADVSRRVGLGAASVVSRGADHLVFERAPGRTLHDLGADGWTGWQRFAACWPALAGAQVDVGAHTAADEARVLGTWMGHARRHGALPRPDECDDAVARTQRALDGPPDAAVLLHRDLHDKQLLWDASTLTVLDLDTAARGEAALDLANLATHLDLRVVQGVLPADVRDAVAALLPPLATELGVTPERWHAYAWASRLRLAAVYAFRPGERWWLPQWVDDTLAGHPFGARGPAATPGG